MNFDYDAHYNPVAPQVDEATRREKARAENEAKMIAAFRPNIDAECAAIRAETAKVVAENEAKDAYALTRPDGKYEIEEISYNKAGEPRAWRIVAKATTYLEARELLWQLARRDMTPRLEGASKIRAERTERELYPFREIALQLKLNGRNVPRDVRD